ncbi:helix-turn-helix domain-containing protein [Desulfobacterales bacterium HSG16]|nr:helix-turn-helix domain-containing protein [Desulfobacterales bacterium HSG16]
MKCYACRKEGMTCEVKRHKYVESGLDNVTLEGIEVYTCPDCGKMPSIPAVPELHTVIGQYLINTESALSGREIRFLRKNSGLSTTIFAKNIGVDKATVSRWENGIQKPSGSHDRLVRLMYMVMKGFPAKESQDTVKKFKDIGKNRELKPCLIRPNEKNLCNQIKDAQLSLKNEDLVLPVWRSVP